MLTPQNESGDVLHSEQGSFLRCPACFRVCRLFILDCCSTALLLFRLPLAAVSRTVPLLPVDEGVPAHFPFPTSCGSQQKAEQASTCANNFGESEATAAGADATLSFTAGVLQLFRVEPSDAVRLCSRVQQQALQNCPCVDNSDFQMTCPLDYSDELDKLISRIRP